MKLLLSLAFAFSLTAQTTPPASLMLSGPATSVTGASITITLTLVNGNGPAGVQWDMTGLPAGAVVTSSVPGKTANCNVTRCLLIGINTAAIPDGAIATIKYTAPSAAVTSALAATMGATPAGSPETIAFGGPLTIGPPSKCDLDSDGKVDQADVGLAIQQALTSPTVVTVVDVIREVIAANGGSCLR